MSKQQKRGLFRATNRGVRVLIAFILGQVVQIIIQAVVIGFAMWDNRRIAFCAAAGFLVTVAVFAGMRIAVKESKEEMHRADDWGY